MIVADLGQDSDPTAGARTGTQQEMQEIAAKRRRFGYRRIGVLLERKGRWPAAGFVDTKIRS